MENINTNGDLYNYILQLNYSFNNYKSITSEILNLISSVDMSEEMLNVIKDKIRKFSVNLHKRWITARRNKDYFLKSNKEWLEMKFSFPEQRTNTKISNSCNKKSFTDCSERHKCAGQKSLEIISQAKNSCLQLK